MVMLSWQPLPGILFEKTSNAFFRLGLLVAVHRYLG
jgi:hypothetical protein